MPEPYSILKAENVGYWIGLFYKCVEMYSGEKVLYTLPKLCLGNLEFL